MPAEILDLQAQRQEQLERLQKQGFVSPEGQVTPRGTLELNLRKYEFDPGVTDRFRGYFDRGFIQPDFSKTEDGRIYFMDKRTAVSEGEEAFARWHELGAWDEWEDKIAPRDPETGEKLPFHKVVIMGIKALATEMVPQAATAAGITARAVTPKEVNWFYDWLGGAELFGAPLAPALQTILPGAFPGYLLRQAREAGDVSLEEVDQMVDDMTAASIGKTVVEAERNQVWITKGLALQTAWAAKELYGKDQEANYVQKLYEFEEAMQEFDDMDAVDGVAQAVSFMQTMEEMVPGWFGVEPDLDLQLKEIERAKEWVRDARERVPKQLLQRNDQRFASGGEFLDLPIPATLAASWSLKIGKRLMRTATKLNREIAEKTAKRALVQRYIDKGVQATPHVRKGEKVIPTGAYKQKVAALTDEIGELQGQLGKIEATTGLGGSLKDLTRGVASQTTAALSKAMSGAERFLGKRDWGTKALDMLDSAKVGISTANKFRGFALVAGSAAGTGAGFAVGGPVLAGVGLLATLPGRLNILKAAFMTVGGMGAELLQRRATNPYWLRVAEASKGNVWARNGALGMDLFRYPARVTGKAAGAGVKGMIAEAPFAMMGSLHRGPEVWAAEMMSEGLLFSSPGMVKGMVHGMGGMPAIAKRAEFDRMALADAAELRRDLDTYQQRAAFDRLAPEHRREAGVYGTTFPDIDWRFDPDATESSWNNKTKRMTIATNSRDPMSALIGHEVAHHLHDRGLVDLVKEELVGPNGALRMTESQYLLSEAKKNQRGEVVLPSEAELQAERDRARMDAEGNIILPDDPGEAGLGTVLPELMPLNELGKEVKQKYEARRGETIGDDELALEYYAESVGAALSGNRIKLQELVRRHPLVRRLIDGTLNRFAFGREFLLRNGVLFDRHGNPTSGQGVMGAIAQSPTLARATETYLRENAGRTVESVSEKAVNRALSQAEPLTAEEEARAIEEDIVNYAFDEDGNVKYLPNGRPEGIDEETWKGRATAGLTIIQDLAERYGVEPVTFKNGEKAYRLSRTQWDEVLRLLHESGWYNPRQLKIFEGMIDAVSRVPGDSFHLHYHGVYSTDKVGKKRVPKQGRHPKSKLGVPYDITVSKHGNILFRMIDMDQLQNNAEKAFNTKLGKELYNSTAEIMRDLETLAKNHKEGKLNLEHFGRQDKVNFLNAILGEINKEHTVKNPLLLKPIFKGFKNKYASMKSFRLDRINRARLANAKALPFRVEEWKKNLMPEPADATTPETDAQAEERSLQERGSAPEPTGERGDTTISRGASSQRAREARQVLAGVQATAERHRFGFAVDVKSPEFYNDPGNTIYRSGDAGAAVTADGDLVSVYSVPGGEGNIDAVLTEASNDADTLDAFDIGGFLPNLYNRYGFRVVARVPFNREYAPPGWDYESAGEPDVVLAVKDPSAGPVDYNEARESVPAFAEWDDAEAHREKILSEIRESRGDDIRRMPEQLDDPTALPIVEARNKDGSVKRDKKGKVIYETIDYDLLSAPALAALETTPQDTTKPDYASLHYNVTRKDRARIDELIDNGSVEGAAADLESDARQAMLDAEIAAGIGWYSRMRKKLKIALAGDHQLFADLLGATSANTDVESNFIYAFDAYRQFKTGRFDSKLARFQEAVDLADTGKLKETMVKRRIVGKRQSQRMDQQELLQKWIERYNLEPRRINGKRYGMNSAHVFRALSGNFTRVRGKRAKDKLSPKTPQFSMNLFGSSLEATIDVWAARYLRRKLYAGQVKQWRIQPKSETGVSNGDFLLGQEIFRRAANKLGMNPDDLQALMWFKEKDVWDNADWTKGAGAIKTSFDQAADAFFPPKQTIGKKQMAKANREGLSSINFIRKRRGVEGKAAKLEALVGQTGAKVTKAKRELRNAKKELTKSRKRAGVAEFLERNPELN